MLVVDVGLPRRLDQLGELTFQPAQPLSRRGTLGGKPLSRTLRRDPRHGTNVCGRPIFARLPIPSQEFVMSDQLTAEGLARLHAVASEHVAEDRIPGLVALVARGDQVHVETLGTLSIGGAPVSGDSVFRIESTTKPITAAATRALAGEGPAHAADPGERR